MDKITESKSLYRNLEQMNTIELLQNINREDQKVAQVIQTILPEVEKAVEAIYQKMKTGGRLFYIGAGTSGRLCILDASECPPTFGVPQGKVIALIAGGDAAIRQAVEFAEDDENQAWEDLKKYNISDNDFLMGVAASGSTPYVIGGLKMAQKLSITTGCITCNPNSPLAALSDFPIVAITGSEIITGSTRMKAGTAQKLILNMISSAVMIKLGRVKDNQMVDMQLSNNKLIDRGIKILMEKLSVDAPQASQLLKKYGSVRLVLESYNDKNTKQ